MAAHSTLTGADLHEPKGVAAATAGQVYQTNGAGSGSHVNNYYTLLVTISNVSSAQTVYVPFGFAGTVKKITSVLKNAITVADATITAKNSGGSSMGTLTIAFSGSAAGDIDTLSPSSNNTFSADDFITVETDGGSTTAAELVLMIEVLRS